MQRSWSPRGPPPTRGVSHTIIEELVDSPGSPFSSLGLAAHQQAGGYERAARRQVSQLRRLKADAGALALAAPPDWGALFADPTLPLVADLGCGAGRCMLSAAVASEAAAKARVQELAGAGGGFSNGGSSGAGGAGGGCNFLGVDVRLALTTRANAWAELVGVRHRGAFMCANANASLPQLLGSYGSGLDSDAASTAGGGARAGSARGDAWMDTTSGGSAGRQVGSAATPSSGSGHGDGGSGGGSGGAAQELGVISDVAIAHRGNSTHGDGENNNGSCASRDGTRRARADGDRGGRVALVCLQFSDPPVRRQALVGGEELVAQLAEALPPGALVWIQSDVRSIASSLRRLFWRHGGFAPSARHATASSLTLTRHWLPPPASHAAAAAVGAPQQHMQMQQGALPGSMVPPAAAPAADVVRAGAGGATSGAVGALAGAARAVAVAAEEEEAVAEMEAEVGVDAVAEAAALPLLLRGVDLGTHQEPWLTGERVAAVVARHRRDAEQRCAGVTHGAARRALEPLPVEGVASEHGAAALVTVQQGRREGGEAGAGRGAERDPQEGGALEDSSTEAGARQEARCEGADALPRPGDEDASSIAACSGEGTSEPDEDEDDSGTGGGDGWAGLPWLDANPLGIPTEREVYVERGRRPIYRLLLVRR